MNLEDKYVPVVGHQEEVSVCQNKVGGLGSGWNSWEVVKNFVWLKPGYINLEPKIKRIWGWIPIIHID